MKSWLLMSMPSAIQATLTPAPVTPRLRAVLALGSSEAVWVTCSASGSSIGLPVEHVFGGGVRVGPAAADAAVGVGPWMTESGITEATAELLRRAASSLLDTVAATALTSLYCLTFLEVARSCLATAAWEEAIRDCRVANAGLFFGADAGWSFSRTMTLWVAALDAEELLAAVAALALTPMAVTPARTVAVPIATALAGLFTQEPLCSVGIYAAPIRGRASRNLDPGGKQHYPRSGTLQSAFARSPNRARRATAGANRRPVEPPSNYRRRPGFRYGRRSEAGLRPARQVTRSG